MAETDLKVILKAKELAEHTLRITSNCNRYPKNTDLYVKELLEREEQRLWQRIQQSQRRKRLPLH